MAMTLKEKLIKKDELFQKIANLQIAANEEAANAAYADHGAFGQANEAVRELEREMNRLSYEIDVLMGNVPLCTHNTISVYIPEELSDEEKAELLEELYKDKEAKSQEYVNRFKRNRPKNYNTGHKQKYYLEEVPYKTAQTIKAESLKGEFLWDPYIKRWYFNIYMFSGQKFDPPARHKQHMLDAQKNHLAHLWSAEIQKELAENPVDNRPKTFRVHGTTQPNIRK